MLCSYHDVILVAVVIAGVVGAVSALLYYLNK